MILLPYWLFFTIVCVAGIGVGWIIMDLWTHR
jgi:hypothetical protein